MPFPDDMGFSMFIYLIIIYTQLKKEEFIRYKKFQYND